MKRLSTLLVVLLPFWTLAQNTSNALLWSISGNGSARTSYVYGTVHSKDDRAYTYVDAVTGLMAEASTIAGELDLAAAKVDPAAMMSMMMMPDDKRLEDLYKKKDWQVVDAYLKAELGFMAALYMRMKPFFVMAMITEASMDEDRAMVLDDHLLEHARDNGHRVIGLESLKEQMRAMDVLPLQEQAAMLLEQARRTGYDDELESMMQAYAAQDLNALLRVSQESESMPPALEKALLTDRNRVMAHRMDSVMRADNGAMFLIGAAHLPGDAGVLKALVAKGYTVEPVVIVPNAPGPTYPPSMLLTDGIRYTSDSLGFSVDMPGVPEQVGERMIEYKEKEQGVLLIVDVLPTDIQDLDLVEVIRTYYGDVVVEPRPSIDVQGLEGRLAVIDMQGVPAEVLLLQHRSKAYFTAAIDRDPTRRRQILDSFRFTDLPE